MENLVSQLVWWHWLVLAMLLLIVEILAPASFFIWIAFAAGAVSLVTLFADSLSWQMQFILFGVLSIVSVLAGRSWFKHRPIKSDEPQLNQRGEQYVGRTLTLHEAISDGFGSVNVDDTRWRVQGPDLPSGASVKVISVDGTVFTVEPV
jgi:membrane protein implicated in regulation of membrane protease activity